MKFLLFVGLPLLTSAFFFPDQFLTEQKGTNAALKGDEPLIQELGGNPEARKSRLEKIMKNEAKKMKQRLPIKLESRMSDVVPIPVEESKDNKDLDIFQLNERLGVAPYLYHGDISLSEEQLNYIERSMSGETRFKRQMSIFARKWPDNTLNFFFEPYNPLNDRKKASVRAAHEYIQSRTCINFVEYSVADVRARKVRDVVAVYNGTGCHAYIGMKGGIQELSLGDGCEYMGTAAHEFSHALGLLHMQARSDRDSYIDVNVDAIQVETDNCSFGQFAEEPYGQDYILTPYDYGSVMHYPADAFVKYKNVLSMTPKDERYLYTLGTKQISFYDILMINALYGCDAKCTAQNSAKCKNGGKPNPRNCAVCNCPRAYGGDFCDERPSECGSNLKATSEWQTEQFTRGTKADKKIMDVATQCTHWITAPAGKQIEVKILHSIHDKCQYGCRYNGIEIKTDADPRVSNPLICCDKFYNQVFTSSLNPTPVVSYDSENFNAFVFQYRYVDSLEPVPVKTTPSTTTTEAPTGYCGEIEECGLMWGFCNSTEPLSLKMKLCGKSCGLCDPTAKATTKTTTRAPAVTEKCKDSPFCDELLAQGICESSDPLALKKEYCGYSCGLCEDAKPAPTSSNCQDMSDRCSSFKKKGLCESNEPFSRKKVLCAKTCGLCGKAASPCVDSPQCASELAAGGCSAMNPMKAEYLCAATCGYCLNPN